MDIKNLTRAKMAFLMVTCLFIQGIAESNEIPIIDAVKALFSLPTAYDYWILKLKSFFVHQGRPYLPPQTFGGGEEGPADDQGTTEKVKEAAVKSLDETKSTVEDSAISAAKLAEEAVDNTVKKLKKTLSHHNHDHKAEL